MTAVLTDPLAANQRGLTAALAEVKAALRRYTGAPDPDERAPAPGEVAPTAGTAPALEVLCGVFGLSPFERAVLLLCAGVELDSDFPAAFGQPYPTFGLALAALPYPHWSALGPAAPLRRWRLIELASGGLTSAALRVDERVLHFLAGVDHLDERLFGLAEVLDPGEAPMPSQQPAVEQVVRAWQGAPGRLPAVQLCGADSAARRCAAMAAAARVGLGVIALFAARLPAGGAELDTVVRLAARDAALSGAALLLEADDAPADWVARLVAVLDAAVLVGTRDTLVLRDRASLAVPVRRPTAAEQRALWREHTGADKSVVDSLTAQFDLGPATIREAARQAGGHDRRALWDACRVRVRPALETVAQRVEPTAGWDSLVVPAAARHLLEQVAAHVEHRLTVYEDWGLGAAGAARGLGTSVLFHGPSGTGKTLAAEVLANELRLDLYRIDLSQVVSKYIGETEKNLRRVFDAAEEGGAVLLFDEADALFGKRSEVRDSHDRYANIEVSYLLQRMEAYRGLAILTTNLREALDTAFLRRIRFLIGFPFPDAKLREEIWRRVFPPATPTSGLDPAVLARLNVAGGSIRNIAVNAAFLAAAAGEPVRLSHIGRAARAEYAKLDRPLTAAEIGGWTP